MVKFYPSAQKKKIASITEKIVGFNNESLRQDHYQNHDAITVDFR